MYIVRVRGEAGNLFERFVGTGGNDRNPAWVENVQP